MRYPHVSAGRRRTDRASLLIAEVRPNTMRVETINAIATTTIALAVGIITLRWWLTDRARLRHELFDRRYQIYERLTGFLADVLVAGRVPPGAEMELLRETRRAHFVFAGDSEVTSLIREIYRGAVDLHALNAEEKSLVGEALRKNIERQRVIKDGFGSTLQSMEARFEQYLKLTH